MDSYAELMQRLLEIQSGGRERSRKLIAEDDLLIDGLQKRIRAGKPPQSVDVGQNGPERLDLKV